MSEKRIVLTRCYRYTAEDFKTYQDLGGLSSIRKAFSMKPEEIIEQIKSSGLRGRGGAGFPTGMKWGLARQSKGKGKFLICNADEGEVGTFKDRFLLKGDPYTLIEGIAIGGYAIGVEKSFIYMRAEYSNLRAIINGAIINFSDMLQTEGLSMPPIEIVEGAGAYICGEESALMESIEGKCGEARCRPPLPTSAGLYGCPTVINNVETLMNIPYILLNGPDWFGSIGTDTSKGTKVFSVCGDVEKPGVYEMVMGIPLRELIAETGRAEHIKCIQVGGASGRVVSAQMLDTPLSYETILGSGAVVVFDDSRDAVDIARQSLAFFVEESCGKCTPCREGTRRLFELLNNIREGKGTYRDIGLLRELSETMSIASACGLGQAAPTVIMDTLAHFEADYIRYLNSTIEAVKDEVR